MTALAHREVEAGLHPLDVAEQVVGVLNGDCERTGEDELLIELGGRWSNYQLVLHWCADAGLLFATSLLDLRVPRERRAPLYELLALINEKVTVGHFDFTSPDATPTFRQTMILRGAGGATVEQIEDLVDISRRELDRFYPAFQYVLWGGRTPDDAIAGAMLEPAGEA